jgi:hypothetical protein
MIETDALRDLFGYVLDFLEGHGGLEDADGVLAQQIHGLDDERMSRLALFVESLLAGPSPDAAEVARLAAEATR